MAAFPSKSGCPMCGIVARGASLSYDTSSVYSPQQSPRGSGSGVGGRGGIGGGGGGGAGDPEIVYRDDRFTVYRERTYPVSSRLHLVVVFNLHVPSLYMLATSDVPLLIALRDLAHRLLSELSSTQTHTPLSPALTPTTSTAFAQPSSPSTSITPGLGPGPDSARSSYARLNVTNSTNNGATSPHNSNNTNNSNNTSNNDNADFRIGFITPPWRDSRIPVKDHLHAHAYVAPADRLGWWRAVAYGPLAWYPVEDLIAEIREESSNNRVRSGKASRPIDRVPDAGARTGTANGFETTGAPLAERERDDGERMSASSASSVSELDLEAGNRNVRMGKRPLANLGVGRSNSGTTNTGTGSSRSGTGNGTGIGGGLRLGIPSRSGSGHGGIGGIGIGVPTPPSPARLASPSQLDLELSLGMDGIELGPTGESPRSPGGSGSGAGRRASGMALLPLQRVTSASSFSSLGQSQSQSPSSPTAATPMTPLTATTVRTASPIPFTQSPPPVDGGSRMALGVNDGNTNTNNHHNNTRIGSESSSFSSSSASSSMDDPRESLNVRVGSAGSAGSTGAGADADHDVGRALLRSRTPSA